MLLDVVHATVVEVLKLALTMGMLGGAHSGLGWTEIQADGRISRWKFSLCLRLPCSQH